MPKNLPLAIGKLRDIKIEFKNGQSIKVNSRISALNNKHQTAEQLLNMSHRDGSNASFNKRMKH
jgi:hypothetical protein